MSMNSFVYVCLFRAGGGLIRGETLFVKVGEEFSLCDVIFLVLCCLCGSASGARLEVCWRKRCWEPEGGGEERVTFSLRGRGEGR